jgi:hypothetical protein
MDVWGYTGIEKSRGNVPDNEICEGLKHSKIKAFKLSRTEFVAKL